MSALVKTSNPILKAFDNIPLNLFNPQGYLDATSRDGKWRVVAIQNDEIASRLHNLLTTTSLDQSKKLYSQNGAKDKTDDAIERTKAKTPIGRFAILSQKENRMIGECGFEYDEDDPEKICIDCAIIPDYQKQGIATWLLSLLLTSYLPFVEVPVYEENQEGLPWGRKKISKSLNGSTVKIRAIFRRSFNHVGRLLDCKFNFKKAGEIRSCPNKKYYAYETTSIEFIKNYCFKL